MNDMFKTIKLTSNVPQAFQKVWEIESADAINTNVVQPLSHHGLIQVVDMLAYDMCTDTHLYLNNHFTEDEWESFINNKAPTIDNIIHVAGLAANVHPDIIRDMVSIRGDYYTEQYILLSEQMIV